MPRLSKADRRLLQDALDHATRALAFIMRDDVQVCSATKHPTAVDYLRVTPVTDQQREHLPGCCEATALRPICKDIGSDLTGLPMAIRKLSSYLAARQARVNAP